MRHRLAGVGLALLFLVPAVPGGARATPACAAGVHQAALVVRHEYDGGLVRRYCVGFDSERVTGEQLLQTARAEYGVSFTLQGYGVCGPNQAQCEALCSVGNEDKSPWDPNEPSHYDACLAAGRPYWGVYVSRGGGSWSVSQLGISSQTFGDGDAEGLSYGSPGPPPPSPAGACYPGADPSGATPPTPRPGGGVGHAQPPSQGANHSALGQTPATAGPGSQKPADSPAAQGTSASAPARLSAAGTPAPGPLAPPGDSRGGVAGISAGQGPPTGTRSLLSASAGSGSVGGGLSVGVLLLCALVGGLLGLLVLQLGRRVAA